MKLSLAWIFDHIKGASYTDYDIDKLVATFNRTTAEIDSCKKIVTDLTNVTIARVIQVSPEKVQVFSDELNAEYTLPVRKDSVEGSLFLIIKEAKGWRWLTLTDWHAQKEGLVPAISCPQKDLNGAWKKAFEREDYILELDNKSVTHRADLWGHRGIAREIAAMLNLELKPEQDILFTPNIEQKDNSSAATPDMPFSLKIGVPEKCKRFAAMYLPDVGYMPSWIWMANRLARVDSKPIDALVDMTNFIMFDIGQPLHAFDAQTLGNKKLEAVMAKSGQKITLLDGETIELSSDDLIISDGVQPRALAGVMGAKDSGVSVATTSVLVEAACFDAATIRKTAMHFKKRTESSTRFEKTLDPRNNVIALCRFLKLLQEENITIPTVEIVSLGKVPAEQHITVAHIRIEQLLGCVVPADFVSTTLKKLGYEVTKTKDAYQITVPSFRATKDAVRTEDIVEEVGRFLGYENVVQELPLRKVGPSNEYAVQRARLIRHFMATAGHAREVLNYALYDEPFLPSIAWQPENAPFIKNPVSQHWTRLITSLIPHLIKNVVQNNITHDRLRFFEINNVWQQDGSNVAERASCAGIFFEKKQPIDFYAAKAVLQNLCAELKLDVAWQKPQQKLMPWYHPFQTAVIVHEGKEIGIAGKIHPALFERVSEGDAFIFELDADFLCTVQQKTHQYEPLPKYPETWFDVSMLVPRSSTVAHITQIIKNADTRITQVSLIDFFEKDEWKDQRSVTMRFYARDSEKTLNQEEIDALYAKVIVALAKIKALIR